MKEMSPEEKLRIEKDAEAWASTVEAYEEAYDGGEYGLAIAYTYGATAEHERMAELLKEERNKAIQECITAMLNDQDILFNGSDILGKLESLKSE